VLTADLVDVRRRADELLLVAFEGERRSLAERLSVQLYAAMRAGIGASREDVEASLASVDSPARARRLFMGLRKILDDHAVWEGEVALDPIDVRRAVFELSATRRRGLTEDARFDRQRVLEEAAATLGSDVAAVEEALFADLRSAEVLRALELPNAEAIVACYARQQVQAVLLRAVRVRVTLRCESPGAYRAIFRQVKFLRLLHVLREGEDGEYELDIDGPFSLFESVTKYGLQLALLLPVLQSAREFRLDADVRWGKGEHTKTLRFRHTGGGSAAITRPLSDEAQALLEDLKAEGGPWRAALADTILSLPGVGLCVPDLALTHKKTGEVIYVELIGFWSRDAVWKRKELVERGLCERVVFVVSSHLRVREELLEDDAAGALYVYKRVPSAKVLLERVQALAGRRVKSAAPRVKR